MGSLASVLNPLHPSDARGYRILHNQAFILPLEGSPALNDVFSITFPIRVNVKVIWISEDGQHVAAQYVPAKHDPDSTEAVSIPQFFIVAVDKDVEPKPSYQQVE